MVAGYTYEEGLNRAANNAASVFRVFVRYKYQP